MTVDVGTLIGGKYELERLLGAGAMGEVWLARHVQLGEPMAVKFLLGMADAGEDAERRFRVEAAISAKLSQRSRHIVRVTDYGDHEGTHYLVMERMVGRTFDEWLEEGPLDLVVWPETALARALRRPLPIDGQLVREGIEVPLLFGGTSVFEPVDEDYGGRGCAVADAEGNLWSFGSYAGE